MRLYRMSKEIEFPERIPGKTDTRYVNVRSAERIDVRPGETLNISTRLRLSFNPKKESVFYISYFNSMRYAVLSSGEELCITVENLGERNIKISPGTVVGELRGEKK